MSPQDRENTSLGYQESRPWSGHRRLGPLPFRRAGSLAAAVSGFGHPSKRPFSCAVFDCIICPRAREIGQNAVALRFGPEIPDQSRPFLAFRPLLLRKKAALLWKIGPHARRQSTTPAACPAAVGCDRDGRSQSRPVRHGRRGSSDWLAAWQRRSHRDQGQEAAYPG